MCNIVDMFYSAQGCIILHPSNEFAWGWGNVVSKMKVS